MKFFAWPDVPVRSLEHDKGHERQYDIPFFLILAMIALHFGGN